MSDVIKFPNAPIREAVIEIRTKFEAPIHSDVLASLQDQLKDRYPRKEIRLAVTSGLKVESDKKPVVIETSKERLGYKFTSVDGKQVVQALQHGFAFSRLRPYDEWATFQEQALDLWEQYKNVTEPKSITRIGLRYINRIEIPLPIESFQDYILTFPEVAPDLPQSLSNFFIRLEIPFEEHGIQAIIIAALEAVTKDDKLQIVFDIDLVRPGPIEADTQKIQDILSKMRNIKNNIFFKSLTDKAKELFK